MRIVLVWLLGALALWLVTALLPGVRFEHPWQLLMAALVMGLINAVVKPILVILTLPITVVTLGLFLLILNALLFWAAAGLVPGFEVAGFGWALLGALLYSVLTGALSLLLPQRRA
ncbi:MAG TPA: phage holin family protein [Burkholderiaceae bacterium]|nr:phage holin family protein [Burkholderiaceae bacterium]